jgi:hypothetical protein
MKLFMKNILSHYLEKSMAANEPPKVHFIEPLFMLGPCYTLST